MEPGLFIVLLLNLWLINWSIVQPMTYYSTSDFFITGHLRGRGTWQDLIRSRFMWLLCCGYAVVYMIRTATQDWSQLYLIHDCKQSQFVGKADYFSFDFTSRGVGYDLFMGSIFLSYLETGGIFNLFYFRKHIS